MSDVQAALSAELERLRGLLAAARRQSPTCMWIAVGFAAASLTLMLVMPVSNLLPLRDLISTVPVFAAALVLRSLIARAVRDYPRIATLMAPVVWTVVAGVLVPLAVAITLDTVISLTARPTTYVIPVIPLVAAGIALALPAGATISVIANVRALTRLHGAGAVDAAAR